MHWQIGESGMACVLYNVGNRGDGNLCLHRAEASGSENNPQASTNGKHQKWDYRITTAPASIAASPTSSIPTYCRHQNSVISNLCWFRFYSWLSIVTLENLEPSARLNPVKVFVVERLKADRWLAWDISQGVWHGWSGAGRASRSSLANGHFRVVHVFQGLILTSLGCTTAVRG